MTDNQIEGDLMTGEKKLNKMCLTGFIFSILPLVLGLGMFILWRNAYDNLDLTVAYIVSMVVVPLSMFVFSIIGLSLSISGTVTARRDGQNGMGLGIAGIALPVLYTVAVVVLLVLFVGSCVKGLDKQSKDRKQSDIYNMGSVGNHENTEYDVSRYRIYEGYELDSSDITVTESELKEYAESRLDTITKSTGFYIKGKVDNYTFLIIRRDRYDEWNASDAYGSVSYWHNGYAEIQYDYQWEFSAGYMCTLDVYKDPSERFIIITNCGDYKVINEFFEGA